MEKNDWLKVVLIFAFLYLANRIIIYVCSIMNYLYGDIVFMVAILLICWAIIVNRGYKEAIKK